MDGSRIVPPAEADRIPRQVPASTAQGRVPFDRFESGQTDDISRAAYYGTWYRPTNEVMLCDEYDKMCELRNAIKLRYITTWAQKLSITEELVQQFPHPGHEGLRGGTVLGSKGATLTDGLVSSTSVGKNGDLFGCFDKGNRYINGDLEVLYSTLLHGPMTARGVATFMAELRAKAKVTLDGPVEVNAEATFNEKVQVKADKMMIDGQTIGDYIKNLVTQTITTATGDPLVARGGVA